MLAKKPCIYRVCLAKAPDLCQNVVVVKLCTDAFPDCTAFADSLSHAGHSRSTAGDPKMNPKGTLAFVSTY